MVDALVASRRTPSLLPSMAGYCLTPYRRTRPFIPRRRSISPPPCRHRHIPHPCRRPQHVMVDALVTSRRPPSLLIASRCRLALVIIRCRPSPLSCDGWLLRPCLLWLCSLSPAFASGESFVAGRCPLSLPIASHYPLALIASRWSSLRCCVYARFIVLRLFCRPLPAPSSSAVVRR
jgi:hypothetical protein